MKKLTGCLMAMFLLISGCTFNVDVLQPEASQPTPYVTQTISPSVETPVATFTATTVPVFTPTLVPPTTYPVFTNARMGVSGDDPNRPTTFPVGTKAVYAIWDYQNMRDGLMVKRVWYWNGQPWITRQEAWDYGKYGANGTIHDISIYDNVTGLNSGAYQLRLYIDNQLQPIGSEIGSPINPWINFTIGSDAGYTELASSDFQWVASVSGGNQLAVRNTTGAPVVLYTGQEIHYLAWFPDNQHILFIDRFHVDPRLGAEDGIQDILWIADAASRQVHLLYESDAPLAAAGNPVISPDGRHIASSQGSGKADACIMSLRSIFFEMADDFQRANVIQQQDFVGIPNLPESTVYPSQAGMWKSNTEYLVPLSFTCTTDQSLLGSYSFDITDRTVSKISSFTGTPIPGDLGWGKIHGRVTDVVTGAPIAGVTITCEHHSYTSPSTCSGSTTTNADGMYVFDNIYFHDTDSITLTFAASGYQTQAAGSMAFTVNDMTQDFSMNPAP